MEAHQRTPAVSAERGLLGCVCVCGGGGGGSSSSSGCMSVAAAGGGGHWYGTQQQLRPACISNGWGDFYVFAQLQQQPTTTGTAPAGVRLHKQP